MSSLWKSLTLVAATLAAQMAFAQASYQYTGRPFTFFSCGPNPNGPGTIDCFNQPAPGNTLTSYTATDHVTATLSFSSPLPPNLAFQDVKAFPGFTLSMNDGHQTLTSGTPSAAGGINAKLSTDGIGQIVSWLLVINEGNAADSGIATDNGPFVQDSGVLACCDPTIHGDIAINQNLPGTWSGGAQTGVTFGAFTRVIQFDSFDHEDRIKGGAGLSRVADGAGSTFGQNVAQAYFKPITLLTATGPVTVNNGPAAGAWSDSNLGAGSGRGLAFTTFVAPSGGPLSFKVNAILDGEFDNDSFGLPNGTMSGGGEVIVVDTNRFNTILQNSGLTLGQFLMGAGTATSGITPGSAFSNLILALGNSVVGSAVAAPSINSVTFGTLLTFPLTTNRITVNPGQQFTVILDVSASTLVGGSPISSLGTGTVDFVRTLQAAPNLFTDDNGNPVVGITAVGGAPTPPPSPASIALTTAQSSNLAGATAHVTAIVRDGSGAPLPGAVVTFTVTGGPNAGASGGGATDANGQAAFAYTGKNGAGTDTVQASIGTLSSNTVSQTWTLNPLTSGAACNGTFNGTFHGNVTVGAGQNCTLMGGTVTGNLMVTGGSASLANFTVSGNLQIQGGGTVVTGPSVRILGNVQIQSLPAGTPASRLCNTAVQNNLLIQNNASPIQIGDGGACPGNTIGGNVEVDTNTAPVAVVGNTIDSNLQCLGNGSVTGSGNTAKQKLGQCSVF